ncbi:hypothetical protein [Demequina sp.]|uniref:hypothetical protein n=1 Tax=Demequina sp. TaxID=2050685 RepID=UPI003A88CBB5
MAEFRIASRTPVAYVGLPREATMDTFSQAIGTAFDDLGRYVEQRGIDTTGASLVRYRVASHRTDFVIEVGFELTGRGDTPVVREPFVIDALPGGHFAVAEQHGPYAWIGGLTRELMAWGDARGMDYALDQGTGGIDTWQCWYEWYPAPPTLGTQGPEGPVEVCLLLRP